MPGKNNVEKARQLGQSIWLDFISREILDNGELKRLVELGVAGVTSNPTIFEKSISSGSLYDADLLAFARRGDDSLAIYEGLALNDIACCRHPAPRVRAHGRGRWLRKHRSEPRTGP